MLRGSWEILERKLTWSHGSGRVQPETTKARQKSGHNQMMMMAAAMVGGGNRIWRQQLSSIVLSRGGFKTETQEETVRKD